MREQETGSTLPDTGSTSANVPRPEYRRRGGLMASDKVAVYLTDLTETCVCVCVGVCVCVCVLGLT